MNIINPDRVQMRAHLHLLYDWASEHDALFEVRCLHPEPANRCQSRRFGMSATALDQAVEYAIMCNRDGYNVYSTPNLLHPTLAREAKDEDVQCANFHYIDVDGGDIAAIGAEIARSGFQPALRVQTGTVPSPRMQIGFAMDDAVVDLERWTQIQRGLAQHFGTDRSIHNPSRVMRLAGSISYPTPNKRGRGYVTERTELILADAEAVCDQHAFANAFQPPEKAAPGRAEFAAAGGCGSEDVPLAVLARAFAVIPNAGDRDQWFEFGAAAKEANPNLGGRAWDDWSRRFATKYDPIDQAKTWAGLKPHGGVRRGTIFRAAKAADGNWWRDGGDVETWWTERAKAFAADAMDDSEENEASFPAGFKMTARGMSYLDVRTNRNGEATIQEIPVCGPFQVLGHTANAASTACGLAIRFRKNAAEHTVIIQAETMHLASNALAAMLADLGLHVETGKRAHDLLQQGLNGIRAKRNLISVKTSGWHRTAKDQWVFLLGDRSVFGDDPDVILQQESGVWRTAGSLEDWQKQVAGYAAGNSRLELFLCASFLPPVLNIIGSESGGMHLFGHSRDGKTTVLSAAASVWGRGAIKDGYVRSWEATSNALEFVAAASCDCLMVLDEIQQANANQVQSIVYKILNGVGKARLTSTIKLREAETWRAFMLSSGETTAAQRIAETGAPVMGGIEARLVNIPSDAGAEMGVFENLHGFASPADLSNHLRHKATKYYGTAIRDFLTNLVACRNENAIILTDAMRATMQDFAKKYVSPNANGQVISVANRFALAVFAGKLAKQWGILPQSIDPDKAGAKCFAAWLQGRGEDGGDTDASEDINAIHKVRRFIQTHGEDRFRNVVADDNRPQYTIHNQAGFKELKADGIHYYVFDTVFGDIVPNMTAKGLAKVLKLHGYIATTPSTPYINWVVKSVDKQRHKCFHVLPVIGIGNSAASTPDED